jgi:hypothetical protein
MSVCVHSLSVLPCVGSDHATDWSPVQGALQNSLRGSSRKQRPFFIFIFPHGVRLNTNSFGLLCQPLMIDDCGAVGGMRIGRGNRSTMRKLAAVPLCPPQIPHDLNRARTRAAAVGSRRLIAWANARPKTVWWLQKKKWIKLRNYI